MNVHRIRLRAPWRQEPLETGAMRWTRSFHRPTNLALTQPVWLVVAAARDGVVQLNGHVLGPLSVSSEARFEVASRLAVSNRLVLESGGPGPQAMPPQPPAEVWLEIG